MHQVLYYLTRTMKRVYAPHMRRVCLRPRIVGPLASLNVRAFPEIGLSHDHRVEIGNSTNDLCHLYVHVVCSNCCGAAGGFPSPVTTRFIANFLFFPPINTLIDER